MQWLTRRTALMAVGLLVSLIFAYLAVRDVDLDALARGLARTNFWMLIPAGLVLAVAVFLRAVRWRILLSPPYRPSTRVVTSALLIGYLFNTILPARAGEAARIVVLKQRAGTPRLEAAGTVAAERALDVLSLLALFFIIAPVLPSAEWLPRALVFGALLFGGLTTLVVAFAVYGERPARLLLRPLARLPGISRERTHAGAANLVRGFALFRRLGIAVRASVLTVLSWLLIAFSFWLVLLGFDLGLGFEAGLLIVVATNLAMILPSGPAAVGVFQAATIIALAAFGVDGATALSYGIVVHALNALPFIPVGYAALHYHAAALRRDVRPTTEEAAPMRDRAPSAG
jgi:glycosyltransferase 2 family protein